jgi:hypothetical protein
MANRLSARSSNNVLLCEAGQDTPDGKVPPEILDSYPGTAYFDPRFHWQDLKVHTEIVSHNQPEIRPPLRKYEQARVLGGGSSINGQLANRGAPSDYDEWEAKGAAGWGWDKVLPYFKKVERDMDFDGPFHGKEGRIPVRRIFPTMWNGHAKAVAKAFENAGFPYIEDQNGEFKPDGYFPITISNVYDRRVSAAIGYLDNGTRMRKNLTISAETQVAALLFEGTRCVGVKALVKGRETEYRAKEAVVSSGAIPFAGASAARRDRPGRAAARSRHRGARQPAGGRPAADGSPVGLGLVVHQARCAAQRHHPPPHPAGAALFVADRRRAGGRHVCRRGEQIGLARGRRADRLAAARGLQDLFRDRTGQAHYCRLARRADGRVQPVVRPARPRAADGTGSGASARCR